MICPKLPVPCTEKDADTFDCPYVGFYVGATDKKINGYCFMTGDNKCPKEEVKDNA